MHRLCFRFSAAFVIIIPFIFIICPASAQEDSHIVTKLDSLYRSRNYGALEKYALRSLLSADSIDILDRAELHKYLGIVYIIQGREDDGKPEFKCWLRLDPYGFIDSFSFPPRIVQLFKEVKDEIRTSAGIFQQPVGQRWKPTISNVAKSILIPGWGQIDQGKTKKGIYILTAQTASISGWLICKHNFNIADRAYHTEINPEKFDDKYDRANNWNKAKWLFASVSIAVYILAQADFFMIPPYISLTDGNSNLFSAPNAYQFTQKDEIQKLMGISFKF
ncbi:hypothetical protein ISS30_06565 [bacterium]|nr:hypothetical protein [FCB group bacterium]MBL7191342.1 hypothetical protein [bacterium]